MNRCYARGRQLIFSKAISLLSTKDSVLIKGNGSILKIPFLFKKEKINCILVITTNGTMKRGTLNELFRLLEENGLNYSIYSEVLPDPTIVCIEKAVRQYKKHGCQGIVAIGGGSVIDCAKIVGARIACPKKSVKQMAGMLKIRKKLPTIFAVPTTAGTGSEITAGAVITDGKNHYKYPILDLCLVPDYAILDPKLTLTLPKEITAATAMDALTHAVEAYTNRFASKKAKKSARYAVKLMKDNILVAYSDEENLEARKNLLFASYHAGIAITNAYVGYVHAIAHAIGGMYGVTHGVANAVILPKVLELYGSSCEKELAQLADLISLDGNTEKEKARNFIQLLYRWNEKMNLPKSLDMIRESDFKELRRRILKEANPTYPVPSIWNEKQVEKALRSIKLGTLS